MHQSYLTTVFDQSRDIVGSFIHFFTTKFLLAILFGVYEFLFGIQDYKAMIALLVLVVIDFSTGITSTRYTGEPITSRRTFKTAVKTGVYCVLITSAHLTEAIVPGVTFIDEAMISFLALTELVSIMENIGKMGYSVPQRLLNTLKKERDDK